MEHAILPHNHLFDELQLAMLPITKELPIIQSLLKWAKSTIDRKETPISLSWIVDNRMQIETLSSLRKSLQELSHPLKELMSHLPQFFPFKPIKDALITFNKNYLEIPPIDNELHLLCLGADLFENKELLTKLILFTEKSLKLQEAATTLKKALLDELLHNLSFSPNSLPSPKL